MTDFDFGGDEQVVDTAAILREAAFTRHTAAANGATPDDESAGFRLQLRTAREVCALADPPGQQLLGDLVIAGHRTIVIGADGQGKTSLVAQMASAILDGDEMLGYVGARLGPVLFVDLEQGLRTIKRVLQRTGLADRDDVYYISVPDGLALDSNPDHLAELHRVIKETAPVMLVLDPYYKAHRVEDPNAERAVVDLMRVFDSLRARYAFALVLPAHPRKDPPGRDGPRKLTLADLAGSGAVTRGAEIVLAIERLSHGYARLRILKDRDGELEVGDAWPLVYSRDQGFRRDAKEQYDEAELEQRILADADTLRTAREWASQLGVRQATAKKILERLCETGRMHIVTGPPGRPGNTRCYGAAPALWDQAGSGGIAQADPAPAPLLPPLIGEQGSGSRRGGAPDPGAGAGLDSTAPAEGSPIDEAELERLADLARQQEATGGRP